MSELFGTKRVVGKKIQVKFYAPSEQAEQCAAIIEQQGCTLSEGMARLMRLLIDAPEELRPILLKQAPGEAARAIAELILANDNLRKGYGGRGFKTAARQR